MESRDQRLQRFESGSPVEIIATLLNSIDNFFNPEIRVAKEQGCWNLALLGVHAVALTISEGLFDRSGLAGYEVFLERFVDADDDNQAFSAIAADIHNWRNVVAHQWLSQRGHGIGFDTALVDNWERRDDVLAINPRRYVDAYLDAFGRDGKIWDWQNILTTEKSELAKQRLLQKFIRE